MQEAGKEKEIRIIKKEGKWKDVAGDVRKLKDAIKTKNDGDKVTKSQESTASR